MSPFNPSNLFLLIACIIKDHSHQAKAEGKTKILWCLSIIVNRPLSQLQNLVVYWSVAINLATSKIAQQRFFSIRGCVNENVCFNSNVYTNNIEWIWGYSLHLIWRYYRCQSKFWRWCKHKRDMWTRLKTSTLWPLSWATASTLQPVISVLFWRIYRLIFWMLFQPILVPFQDHIIKLFQNIQIWNIQQ